MRNLAVFLVRHYFFLLFLLLESLSLYFLVQRNYYAHSSAVSSANWFTGSIYQAKTDFTQYLDLKEQNKLLAARLADSLSHQNSSFLLYTSKTTAVSDTFYKQRYEYLTAEVIDNTVERRNNLIILNRGKLQGVETDMGVVGPQGVVGVVLQVSDNFCVVMSVLHKDTKISASLKKDESFGQLSWEGVDYRHAKLTDLQNYSKITVGDTIMCSGLGEVFPKGEMVGTVSSFTMKSGEKTYTADILLATDFRKLHHVFIVKNLMKTELDDLKNKSGFNNGQ
jgi:rod shape-determining protein MreC